MDFNELDLTKLDKNLTEAERDEWQAIYASYRGRSLISGEVRVLICTNLTLSRRERKRLCRRRFAALS